MARQQGFFGPSQNALEFGAQYADVLARWGELFVAASALVDANVKLGGLANDAAKEFDQWIRQSASAPWNWMNPDMVGKFMESITRPPKA